MKWKTITLSYPVVRYTVNVSYYKPRHSTALEWLILEVVHKAQTDPKISGVPVASVMENLFCIHDVNRLILPCILDLRDNDALTADSIDDESDLTTVPLRDLKLTPDGIQMQKEGLLPGKTSVTAVTITYDPIRRQIIPPNKSGMYSEQAEGLPVRAETDVAQEFPSAAIMEYLEHGKQTGLFGKTCFACGR